MKTVTWSQKNIPSKSRKFAEGNLRENSSVMFHHFDKGVLLKET